MINKYFLLIVYFLITICGYSQQSFINEVEIKGIVHDSILKEPVEMAAIGLYLLRDSTFVKGTTSDRIGVFVIKNLQRNAYYLTINYLGYKTKYISIPEKNILSPVINLGKINLETADIQLASVIVTSEIPELVVKEDTLEYNAAAFRLTESAVVEDLLKRLPGVEVDTEGKITTSTGKEVRRVFVDGKEFFGNDPKMATKNLSADMVDKVQIVEKKSDLAIQTGVEDDDPETIINITIKKGMKKGWMGNVSGGMGGIIDNKNNEDARYMANGNINRFTEQNQFTFIANANNINNRASTDRGNTVKSGRGGGNNNGITSSNTFGVNMNNIINDNLKFGGNIAYNYSDNYDKSKSIRENLRAETLRESLSQNRNYSNNISFDGKLEYKPDSMTTMIFTPSLSYNNSSSRSASEQFTITNDADSVLQNESSSFNTLESDGFQLRLQYDISRKLSSTGRRISFSGWYNINNSTGNGTSISDKKIFGDKYTHELLDQRSRRKGDRTAYNLRLAYVEPVGKGRFLNFSYNIQVNDTKNRRETLDYDSITGTYAILNPAYSKSSDTRSTTHNIRANFNSHQTNYSYNIGISISPVTNNSKTFIKDFYAPGQDSIPEGNPIKRTSVNYSPFLDFTYRMNTDTGIRRNFRFRYNGRTIQPSVNQLTASSDNSNILNIYTGNPNLLPAFSNNLSLEFNKNNRENQRSITALVSHTFVQNQIINYTTYEEGGTQRTSPVNQNGFWNSAANILLSLPLDNKKKLRFSSRTGATYNNQISYSKVEGKDNDEPDKSEKNVSNTFNLNQNLNLSYSNDWYYGQLRGTFRYSHTKYSLEISESRESYNFSLTYNTQLTLPYNLSVASDISYTGNRGLSAGYNQNEVMWNAEFVWQFLKRKQGSLRFRITDILQERVNIRRTYNDNYLQDTQFTALSSYFIVSFAYRFNNVGGGREGRRRSGGSSGEFGGGGRMRDGGREAGGF